MESLLKISNKNSFLLSISILTLLFITFFIVEEGLWNTFCAWWGTSYICISFVGI